MENEWKKVHAQEVARLMQNSARLVFALRKSQLISALEGLPAHFSPSDSYCTSTCKAATQLASQTPKAGPLYVALQVFWVGADSSWPSSSWSNDFSYSKHFQTATGYCILCYSVVPSIRKVQTSQRVMLGWPLGSAPHGDCWSGSNAIPNLQFPPALMPTLCLYLRWNSCNFELLADYASVLKAAP